MALPVKLVITEQEISHMNVAFILQTN